MSLKALSGIARFRRHPSIPTHLRLSTSFPNSFHTSPHPRHPLDVHPEQQQQQQPAPTSTVNNAEIAHFSRLSALWWDERGEFSLRHKMNTHRMRFIHEKVLEVWRADRDGSAIAMRALEPEPSRVLEGLDVGCAGETPSMRRGRTSASRHAMPLPIRASQYSLSAMHPPRCLSRSRSDSTSNHRLFERHF